ncbi:hypothetical protein C2S52_011596 [Perilla frutescens var. hirtella]|nr:hypothetical protein C2S52_011596 [Perilla frutescens var. hirtella]
MDFGSILDNFNGFKIVFRVLDGTQRSVGPGKNGTQQPLESSSLAPNGRWSAIIGKASGRWGRVTAGVPDFNSSPAAGTQRLTNFPNPSKFHVQMSDFILCNFHVISW